MNTEVQNRYQDLVDRASRQIAADGRNISVVIQVGSATCENAAGAPEVWREFERNIEASGRRDIALHRVGCTGRCSREPIVGILRPGQMPVKYQRVNRDTAHEIFTRDVLSGILVEDVLLGASGERSQRQVILCAARKCLARVEGDTEKVFLEEIEAAGLPETQVQLTKASGLGFCSKSPAPEAVCVMVRPENVVYFVSNRKDIRTIVQEHLVRGDVVEKLLSHADFASKPFFDLYGDVAFFNRQNRIALRNAGVIDPESVNEYVRYNGFKALSSALAQGDPEQIVNTITDSKLRGRGGGGYPTGLKWAAARRNEETTRYIICNADEGDPGAFMDRSMLESDPFSVIEGMIIGGYTIGASRGFLYIRAEYPLAIRRIEHAIAECRKNNLLGDNILGSGFSMDLEVRLGAGAFVCGEETALIHSIEGERGQPRIRPPFPSESGLWGKPTV
ncbi:MAG: hypothetical protein JW852_01650, partial [Spirochaetales bacterium]|nr:hypothetical protein [Spirochaetales bacterium]